MKLNTRLNLLVAVLAAISSTFVASGTSLAQTPGPAAQHASASAVKYKSVTIDGLEIFYREAGPQTARDGRASITL